MSEGLPKYASLVFVLIFFFELLFCTDTVSDKSSVTGLKYPTPAIGGLFYGVASGSVLGRASNAHSEKYI